MAAEERTVLQLKYKSKQIANLQDEELRLHVMALLLKIHVITGWRIPEKEALLTVLQDQFFKKLTENYSDCNIDEVEYAFRNYGTNVEDWGKDLNLKFIDAVMNSYLRHRRSVSETEATMRKPKQEIPTDEQLLSMKRELIEMKYQDFLKGSSSFTMQPADGIATLALDGFCDFEIYEDFLEKALSIKKREMKKSIEDAKLQGRTAFAEDSIVEMDFLNECNELVILLAKKIALIFCFLKFKEAGYLNIYFKEYNE